MTEFAGCVMNAPLKYLLLDFLDRYQPNYLYDNDLLEFERDEKGFIHKKRKNLTQAQLDKMIDDAFTYFKSTAIGYDKVTIEDLEKVD